MKINGIYEIEIQESIGLVDENEWDSLINNASSSYGWLKTVEETYIGDTHYRYISVKKNSHLIGASACYIAKKIEQRGNIDSELLGRLKKYSSRLGFSFLPALICGNAGEHFLIDKQLSSHEHDIILNLILETITTEAIKNKLSICFRYLREDEKDLMALLKKNGFNHTPVIPYLYIDIKWTSFDDYIKSLRKISKNMKKSVLYEINKNRKKGVRIEIEKEPGKYEDRLFELINIHYLKYNGEPFYLNKEFINKAQEYIGHDCKFYISWENGKITGTSFSITANGTQNNYISVVDRKLAQDDLTFFNISFHKPLMDAISNDIKKIDYGLGMAEMKIRRGCKTGNQFLCYKASNNIFNITIKPWFILLSKWYQRKNTKVSNRFN